MLVHEIKDYKNMTVADALEVADFVRELNYLEAEGFITIEEDENGETRLYPAS